jgi:hypothetical protein
MIPDPVFKDICLTNQRYRNELSKIYDWKAKDIGLKTDGYLYFCTLF